MNSAATNGQTGEGVAIKKVTNVFSKKILAKRALREIKLLQHFRGHRNVGGSFSSYPSVPGTNRRRSRVCMIWTYPDLTTSTRLTSMKVDVDLFWNEILYGLTLCRTHGMRLGGNYSLRATTHRRSFPVIHIPDSLRAEIHPFSQRATPRLETWKLTGQRRL